MLAPVLGIGRLWWRTTSRAVDAALLAGVDALLASRTASEVVDRVTARVLRGPELERVVDAVLASPAVERVVDAVLASPAVERVVAHAISSDLFDETVERLLASEQLWRLVEEVARSPAVTDAIAQQGLGFADQVAGEVRSRSRTADAWLERAAGRALRRRPPAEPEPA
jgi:hypothetical protein